MCENVNLADETRHFPYLSLPSFVLPLVPLPLPGFFVLPLSFHLSVHDSGRPAWVLPRKYTGAYATPRGKLKGHFKA